jgi:ABC-type transport system involved in cytochrome c biogenesis permease subunit
LTAEVHPWTRALAEILTAYRENKADQFNRDVAHYTDLVAGTATADVDTARLGFESLFNGFAPFYICTLLYFFAFVLAALSWFGWSGPLSRAALWLTAGTLVLHTLAIVARIYISGRPPVTNLYTTAIFIGWVCALLGFILELVYRLGVGTVVAGLAGFITLNIASGLAARGDTFTVMQAVLDTQFWLATHVVAMNTGYAASFLAGLFGVLYIVMGLFAKNADSQTGKQLARMIYGGACFAIFTSFVGTVLGGLWADDSWGRFWGWDPRHRSRPRAGRPRRPGQHLRLLVLVRRERNGGRFALLRLHRRCRLQFFRGRRNFPGYRRRWSRPPTILARLRQPAHGPTGSLGFPEPVQVSNPGPRFADSPPAMMGIEP